MWTSYTDKRGYARVFYKKRMRSVSRLILAKKLGRPLKRGMMACHTCDEPSCVTEDHLWEGTNKDNQRDMKMKLRASHGEAHYKTNLTAQIVRKIRRMAPSHTYQELADIFQTNYFTVWNVVKRRSWIHI